MFRATRSRLAPLSLVPVSSLHTVRLASAVTATGSVDSAPAAAETGPAGLDWFAGATLNMLANPGDNPVFQGSNRMSDMQVGRCVPTVSATADDEGRADGYWQSREKGGTASCAQIAQVENAWTRTDATVPGHPIGWCSIGAVKGEIVRIGLAEIEAWTPG